MHRTIQGNAKKNGRSKKFSKCYCRNVKVTCNIKKHKLTIRERLCGSLYGHQSQANRRQQLNNIKPKIKVTTASEARSEKALEYALRRLYEGIRYDELRREFGCGPAHLDKNWRIVKGRIEAFLMSELKADFIGLHLGHNKEIKRLEALFERAELGFRAASKSRQHIWLKLKLTIIKEILRQIHRHRQFIFKSVNLAMKEQRYQGPSLIIQFLNEKRV